MSGLTLDNLQDIYRRADVVKLYVKKMAENDNTKQQIYLGGNFSALNILPYGEVKADNSIATPNFKAPLKLSWIDDQGRQYPAPYAQLILYPDYPEVRLSGVLKGCQLNLSDVLAHRPKERRNELVGRKLFLGVTSSGEILAYISSRDQTISKEIDALEVTDHQGVFIELPMSAEEAVDTKQSLLNELKRIHLAGWIDFKRLLPGDQFAPCESSNCGGYTLEAELGVLPNGYAAPDYLGWEIKQHGVLNFLNIGSKAITLMTPEPTYGLYKDSGAEAFVRKYGYADKLGREDRLNFGGIYRYGFKHKTTNLKLELAGYEKNSGKIIDPNGGIILLDESQNIAAGWSFTSLMEHWKNKHTRAAYIPSMNRTIPAWQYQYGNTVRLGEGTDFLYLLKAIAGGQVYYDPAIKIENASSEAARTKRRSQFRIKASEVNALYNTLTTVDLLEVS